MCKFPLNMHILHCSYLPVVHSGIIDQPGLPVTDLPVNFAIHVYNEPTLVYCNSVFSLLFFSFPSFTPYYTTIKKSNKLNVFNWHVLL